MHGGWKDAGWIRGPLLARTGPIGVAVDCDPDPCVEARMTSKARWMAKGIALGVVIAVVAGCGASSPTSPTVQVQPAPQPQPPVLQE